MRIPRFLPLSIAILFISSFSVFAAGWGDNYKQALETAAKENKNVLLDFTGSDWCVWCIRLKKETFDKQQFTDYADKNLVLVEVDFPQGKSLSPPAAVSGGGISHTRFADASGKSYQAEQWLHSRRASGISRLGEFRQVEGGSSQGCKRGKL